MVLLGFVVLLLTVAVSGLLLISGVSTSYFLVSLVVCIIFSSLRWAHMHNSSYPKLSF